MSVSICSIVTSQKLSCLWYVMCCTVTWRRLSAVPGASPIHKKADKEGKQSAPEVLKRPKYEWNSADWEVLPNISSFYHLSPDACNSLCKAITQISEAAKVLCDTKQMPSVILYLQFLGEIKWGNAALLTWYAHADICFPLFHTHMHTQVINLTVWQMNSWLSMSAFSF